MVAITVSAQLQFINFKEEGSLACHPNIKYSGHLSNLIYVSEEENSIENLILHAIRISLNWSYSKAPLHGPAGTGKLDQVTSGGPFQIQPFCHPVNCNGTTTLYCFKPAGQLLLQQPFILTKKEQYRHNFHLAHLTCALTLWV